MYHWMTTGRMRAKLFFFFQAEDGIRDDLVTGVQTCALPISASASGASSPSALRRSTVPPTAPSDSTARMILASATFPSSATVIRDLKSSAVLTNVAPALACQAQHPASATLPSETDGTSRIHPS